MDLGVVNRKNSTEQNRNRPNATSATEKNHNNNHNIHKNTNISNNSNTTINISGRGKAAVVVTRARRRLSTLDLFKSTFDGSEMSSTSNCTIHSAHPHFVPPPLIVANGSCTTTNHTSDKITSTFFAPPPMSEHMMRYSIKKKNNSNSSNFDSANMGLKDGNDTNNGDESSLNDEDMAAIYATSSHLNYTHGSAKSDEVSHKQPSSVMDSSSFPLNNDTKERKTPPPFGVQSFLQKYHKSFTEARRSVTGSESTYIVSNSCEPLSACSSPSKKKRRLRNIAFETTTIAAAIEEISDNDQYTDANFLNSSTNLGNGTPNCNDNSESIKSDESIANDQQEQQQPSQQRHFPLGNVLVPLAACSSGFDGTRKKERLLKNTPTLTPANMMEDDNDSKNDLGSANHSHAQIMATSMETGMDTITAGGGFSPPESLLHQSCRLYAQTAHVVGSAIKIDPNDVPFAVCSSGFDRTRKKERLLKNRNWWNATPANMMEDDYDSKNDLGSANHSHAQIMATSIETGMDTITAGGEFSPPESLLHQSCRLYAQTAHVVDSAIKIDPNDVRKRWISPSQRQQNKLLNYSFPINIALQNRATLDVLELLIHAAPEVLTQQDGPEGCGSLALALEKYSLPAGRRSSSSRRSINRQNDNSNRNCATSTMRREDRPKTRQEERSDSDSDSDSGDGSSSPLLKIVTLMCKKNADCPNLKDKRSNYPLHIACSKGSCLSVVKILVRANPAVIEWKNFHGQTPLDIAQRCGGLARDDVIDYLMQQRDVLIEQGALFL